MHQFFPKGILQQQRTLKQAPYGIRSLSEWRVRQARQKEVTNAGLRKATEF